jgi:hypothetical protein
MELLHLLTHFFSRGRGCWALAIFVAVPFAVILVSMLVFGEKHTGDATTAVSLALTGAALFFFGRWLDRRDGRWVVDEELARRVQIPSHHTFLGGRVRDWAWFAFVLGAGVVVF